MGRVTAAPAVLMNDLLFMIFIFFIPLREKIVLEMN